MNPGWTDREARWADLRSRFRLAPHLTFMNAMLMASHPDVVRHAIARHQDRLDADPQGYLRGHAGTLFDRVATLAARYLGLAEAGRTGPCTIALTDSTTMGLGLLFNGISMRDDQHFLMPSNSPYFSTEALKHRTHLMDGIPSSRASRYADDLAADPCADAPPAPPAPYGDVVPGDRVEEFDLDLSTAFRDDGAGGDPTERVVTAVTSRITPKTRVLALTWVSSATGWKIPVAEICAAVRELNEKREPGDRIITVVDGVHGFGIEDFSVEEMGCDFFVTGCHKWLFGPRGTGFVYGRPAAWAWVSPIIPRFRGGAGPGKIHSPGGIHSYASRWALAEAFELHFDLGKAEVEQRTRMLVDRLHDGLAATPGVRVVTPRGGTYSSGIVCCAVEGVDPGDAANALFWNHRIRCTESLPDGFGDDAPTYLRLSPSVLNSEFEIDRTVRAVAAVARGAGGAPD